MSRKYVFQDLYIFEGQKAAMLQAMKIRGLKKNSATRPITNPCPLSLVETVLNFLKLLFEGKDMITISKILKVG